MFLIKCLDWRENNSCYAGYYLTKITGNIYLNGNVLTEKKTFSPNNAYFGRKEPIWFVMPHINGLVKQVQNEARFKGSMLMVCMYMF